MMFSIDIIFNLGVFILVILLPVFGVNFCLKHDIHIAWVLVCAGILSCAWLAICCVISPSFAEETLRPEFLSFLRGQ